MGDIFHYCGRITEFHLRVHNVIAQLNSNPESFQLHFRPQIMARPTALPPSRSCHHFGPFNGRTNGQKRLPNVGLQNIYVHSPRWIHKGKTFAPNLTAVHSRMKIPERSCRRQLWSMDIKCHYAATIKKRDRSRSWHWVVRYGKDEKSVPGKDGDSGGDNGPSKAWN